MKPTRLHRSTGSVLAAALSMIGASAAEIDHHGADGGGGPSGSASYRNHGSVGTVGGLGVGSVSGAVNRGGFAAQLNETPDIPVQMLTRQPGKPLKFLADIVGAGLSDPEGDGFGTPAISPTSSAGISVSPDGPWLVYEAPPAAPANDSVAYFVTDSIGDRAMGTILIVEEDPGNATVGQSRTLLRIEMIPATESFRVTFAGIPGRLYRVETATDIAAGPWLPFGTAIGGADGLYSVTNTPALNDPVRFFRSLYQP